jgi:cGMP-dependent protein kinase 2
MSHVLIEKTDHLSDTIFKYQKGKHVMATPSNLVLRWRAGPRRVRAKACEFEAGKRETILGIWNKQAGVSDDPSRPIEGDVPSYPINVQAQRRSHQGRGRQGRLIHTKSGEVIKAETIVLAIGTQGNPNVLRCPGADHPMIQYQLDDPGEYFDEHITVVGSGDAGIENALGLAADERRATSSPSSTGRHLCPRQEGPMSPCSRKPAALTGGSIVRNETTPAEVKDGELVLETRDGQETIPATGSSRAPASQPPRGFVEAMGIEFTSEERAPSPS